MLDNKSQFSIFSGSSIRRSEVEDGSVCRPVKSFHTKPKLRLRGLCSPCWCSHVGTEKGLPRTVYLPNLNNRFLMCFQFFAICYSSTKRNKITASKVVQPPFRFAFQRFVLYLSAFWFQSEWLKGDVTAVHHRLRCKATMLRSSTSSRVCDISI